MRLYHQERATRGRVPFARRVLPAEKEKAADSQLIILMWKAEGFLLASDFSEELSKTFSSQLVSTWGERCGEGGRPGCCQGAPAPSPGFALQNLPCKRAHYPLGKGTFGICPDCWAIYIETRRKLLRSLRRENGEKRKKRGLQPGKTRRETPQKGGIRSKVSREGPIRSMENEFGNSLEKSPQTRMKPNKNGLNI